MRGRFLTMAAAILAAGSALTAAEWPHWRGPFRDGTSPETGLISDWSPQGRNLLWRRDFVGRSTPVVFDGRVCVNGRVGEGVTRQERVVCFDRESGEQLWEHRFNVYNTTVPWNRVGWANVTGDPETGYLYVQGVGGLFFCLDSRDGRIVWSRNLIEEFGFMEGYGGRTQTPVVDEDRLVVTFANSGWGAEGLPRHRLRAFDKRTGELLWVSTPGEGSMKDKNTQSTPAVAVIDGERLLIQGNGDGWIYAVQARTGKKVWGFHLSQRGINTSVVVDGTTVYAAHSEENVDELGTMGRVVAIDATGTGDVTASHEIWRAPVAAGFSSPVLAGGRLYVVDNSANLHALAADSGEGLWTLNLGRVGKGSPVWADGKLYVTEVNGLFLIVGLSEEGGEILSRRELEMESGRYAEIYGSPAISDGRIYFTTEEGIYCLGGSRPGPEDPAEASFTLPPEAPPGEEPALLLLLPAEVHLEPGESATFTLRSFDANGRALGPVEPGGWELAALQGELAGGTFTASPEAASHAGSVKATRGDLSAEARVRVVADLPQEEDFEAVEVGSRPSWFLGYVSRFEVAQLEEEKVLAKGPSPIKIDRHFTFVGRPNWSGYTVQADLLGTRDGRRVPDLGLINSGYTLDLMGAHQQLQVRSWPAELRMAEETPFAWETGVWYTMKMRVDVEENRAVIRGKVWRRGEPEPEEWTITAEDPIPIRQGSPGLYGYSPSFIYFDNVKVTRSR